MGAQAPMMPKLTSSLNDDTLAELMEGKKQNKTNILVSAFPTPTHVTSLERISQE